MYVRARPWAPSCVSPAPFALQRPDQTPPFLLATSDPQPDVRASCNVMRPPQAARSAASRSGTAVAREGARIKGKRLPPAMAGSIPVGSGTGYPGAHLRRDRCGRVRFRRASWGFWGRSTTNFGGSLPFRNRSRNHWGGRAAWAAPSFEPRTLVCPSVGGPLAIRGLRSLLQPRGRASSFIWSAADSSCGWPGRGGEPDGGQRIGASGNSSPCACGPPKGSFRGVCDKTR